MAANKFGFSEDSLRAICPENAEKPLIVPLTSSLYITGQVGDIDKVIVDVGTGYFIEKSPTAATDFLQRKQADLKKKCEPSHFGCERLSSRSY